MKIRFYLLLAALFYLTGCTDKCKEASTFWHYFPLTFTVSQICQGVRSEPARALVNPDKIYTKDQLLFINELKKGIHVIDNRDPPAPRPVAFISIFGNGDIVVRNNILYADSYMDLVAFDISSPAMDWALLTPICLWYAAALLLPVGAWLRLDLLPNPQHNVRLLAIADAGYGLSWLNTSSSGCIVCGGWMLNPGLGLPLGQATPSVSTMSLTYKRQKADVRKPLSGNNIQRDEYRVYNRLSFKIGIAF